MSTPTAPQQLIELVARQTDEVKKKLDELQGLGDQISIQDMFEMQMLMNKLSQLSEMSTSVISASNAAIASMARNVKS